LRRGDNDRHRPEHPIVAGASLSIGAWDPFSASFACRVRCAVIPDANGDEAENDNPEPPAALDGLCRGRITRAPIGKLYGVNKAMFRVSLLGKTGGYILRTPPRNTLSLSETQTYA
jgi:hypothetical protein